ncbi:MAG: exopolysaccharide Pel transporter PelG [Aquificaceae bacterium]|nr:exopolysaccharide Pel transporter PelG [Aquificaceae bacterium]
MAGIAFELRKILGKRNLSAIFTAFGYSFALSSGPYFITITSLILVNFLGQGLVEDARQLTQFQVVVTHIMAISLIMNGFSNLFLIRYLSDLIFVGKTELIVPNMMGAIFLNMFIGFALSLPLSIYLLAEHGGYPFAFLFTKCVTVMMGVWTLNIILTGFKSYKFILLAYFIGYALFLILSFFLITFGLPGLMFAFFIANFLIFSMFLGYMLKNYYFENLLSFDFLREGKYKSLILTGFFYNLGMWADKLVFWYHPYTSTKAIGPISYSVVYDIPVFLAYLSIAPGMSAMFLKVEWEFAEHYDRYYDAVREGDTLDKIYLYGDELISSARSVLLDTFRVQLIFSIFIVIMQELIFSLLRIPLVYIPLFDILLMGTSLQVVFLSLVALIFYFDKLYYAFLTTMFFATANLFFSFLSIHIGPYFYGYGFALSVFISLIVGIVLLRRFLHDIHYYTFMHI